MAIAWIAIFGAFMLAVFAGHPRQQERSDGSDHRPAIAEVAAPAEPGALPHAEGAPTIYKKD
jgi:hypothetical protein